MQTRTVTVDYARPRGYDVGYRAENNFTLLALPVPVELKDADSYRVYFESTVGEYLQTELLTPADGYVTVKITSDIVPEPGNMAAQLVAFADGEIVGYAPMITGSAKVSIPDGTERLSHSLAAEIALNTAARHSHENKAVLDKFAESDGKPTYDGKAIGGGGASTAEDISYTLSEDVKTDFPDIVELESDTVKSGLDVAMYYALAGMFAKYIQCDMQGGGGTVSLDLQHILDNFVFPAMLKAHEHDNKSILDLISAADGKLQYDGKAVESNGNNDFIINLTLVVGDDDFTATSDVSKADIDAAYTAGKNLIVHAALSTVVYTLPLFSVLQNQGDNTTTFIFGATFGGQTMYAELNTDWVINISNVGAYDIGYENAALQGVDNVKAALDALVTAQVATGTEITLADNTEYRLENVTTLTLTYPTGNFECWLKLSFAASGSITVTLPTGTKYIGNAPSFGNGETWEMSIKDGVVIAQKVGDGT